MSNAKDILNRVYEIVMGKESTEIKVELAQAKTADGQAVLEAEAFEVGQAVFIVTEEGNIPVPMGEYMLEDGMKIEVDEQGVIVEVSAEGKEEIVEEVIEAEDEPMKEQIEEEMTMPKKVVKSKTEMEESYFSKIETRLSAIEKANEDLKAVNVQLSAENEELKKQLAESPAEHTKFNPEATTQTNVQFRIGSRRGETIQDRVFNQLF
jgi:hypothetical protein